MQHYVKEMKSNSDFLNGSRLNITDTFIPSQKKDMDILTGYPSSTLHKSALIN